ncbi:hypothetical protein B0O80DRAFT_495003 [Mortierella sp. GBAus27b]|nr:hypothetical protein BGX31_003967 [Mortierella sp. GBA43]KAI8359467.1 hypothetical protein B0O80DRAFT_495003 [Mortierella sp. GBAus27b]
MTGHTLSLKSTLLLLSQLSALILCSSSAAHAQTFQPRYTYSANSAFNEGDAFYIHGGSTSYQDNAPLTQTLAIDLSVSWPADKPAYKQLPDGPISSGSASTLSADKMTWFIVSNGTAYTYSFQSANWNAALPGTPFSDNPSLYAVTDPDTGLIYVPFGISGPQSNTTMLRIDLGNNRIDNVLMPTTDLLDGYYVAWSAALKGLVIFGGVATSLADEPSTKMSIYNPQTGWSSATLGGDVPVPRQYSCFKPAYEGSKMVLFGGSRQNGTILQNDIFILDVATNTWRQGPSATNFGAAREYPSCAVSGHLFIVWAGAVELLHAAESVLIYNMRTDQWISKYYPPDFAKEYQGGEVPSASKRSVVAIALGSVFAGLVVLSAIGASILCWARNKPEPRSTSTEERGGNPYGQHSGPNGVSPRLVDSKKTLVIQEDNDRTQSNPPALNEPKKD